MMDEVKEELVPKKYAFGNKNYVRLEKEGAAFDQNIKKSFPTNLILFSSYD
jgi:hypothetical protein